MMTESKYMKDCEKALKNLMRYAKKNNGRMMYYKDENSDNNQCYITDGHVIIHVPYTILTGEMLISFDTFEPEKIFKSFNDETYLCEETSLQVKISNKITGTIFYSNDKNDRKFGVLNNELLDIAKLTFQSSNVFFNTTASNVGDKIISPLFNIDGNNLYTVILPLNIDVKKILENVLIGSWKIKDKIK